MLYAVIKNDNIDLYDSYRKGFTTYCWNNRKIQITKYTYRMILFVVGKNVDIYTYTCVKQLTIGRYPLNIYQINEKIIKLISHKPKC